MQEGKIYEDIALRTEGDIYIGVVGPVRTGKSTFIKRFMETLVIPNIDNVYRRERARDELPQSGSGRTIMTAEPKFVPEEAASVTVEGGASFRVRLIDCVGYMVTGAVGQMEGELERMVTTPWFDHEIPMAEAAEVGTRKVISEHSTIGVVVTTDGTVTDIPREDYQQAEERAIQELKELGKPFVVVLNSAQPASDRAQAIRADIAQRYDVTCIAVNCLELGGEEICQLLKSVLYEFPLKELDLFLPPWVDALPQEHPIKAAVFAAIRAGAEQLRRIRDAERAVAGFESCESVSRASLTGVDLGGVQAAYDKVADALREVEETGYGIVVPTIDSLTLEEPEIVRQGGRYGVRLRASGSSIHMIRADIQTEVSPIVGGEKQSEDMIRYLLQEYEGDSSKIWEANIFGKSLHELVNEDLNAKLKRMPQDAREKLRETLQRIINEGSGGLICIIL